MNTTNPTTNPTTMNTEQQPEPLAAIFAEMRADVADGENAFFIRADWLALCDRIEAAYKREHAEAKDYFAKLHDGPSMICTAKNCAVRNIGISLAAPGNAAAMRVALEWAAQFVELGVDDELGADGQNLTTAAEMARAALDAPARNCDRFADCNSAWKAYNAIADRERLPGFDFWLFAPAKGGAK